MGITAKDREAGDVTSPEFFARKLEEDLAWVAPEATDVRRYKMENWFILAKASVKLDMELLMAVARAVRGECGMPSPSDEALREIVKGILEDE